MRVRFGIIAALLLAACASVPSAREVHDDGYDMLEVHLDVTADFDAQSIVAEQSMRLRADVPLSELRFDANALSILSASLDGQAVHPRTEGQALIFTLPHTLRAGDRATLQIRYEGQPARGLVFGDGFFYTSYFACDWMVCELDRPGDKFMFDVRLHLAEDARAFTAESSRPYPAYLQGFGGGALTQVRERVGDTELVYASHHASGEDLRAIFAETGRMLVFFERAAGIPFPSATYTQLLVTGDAAQEGAGFAILGDDVVRPILTNPQEDWAIAHELAHQYWGNLVTCEDWSEFWLNEGLTTFMVAIWKEERWGASAYQQEVDNATRRWTRAREAGWDRPLAFSGAYPSLRTRRDIQYGKGMLFFVELRRTLGDDVFWRGIRTYTRTHAGGTVSSADLQRAMERESGRDLSALFVEWVDEAPAAQDVSHP